MKSGVNYNLFRPTDKYWEFLALGYMVLRGGNVWSKKLHRFLRWYKVGGYRIVTLNINKERIKYKVHRLVALCYLPKVEGRNDVNHKDGKKWHNHYTNLEWCTPSENTYHGLRTGLIPYRGEDNGMTKLRNKDVIEIRQACILGTPKKEILKRYPLGASSLYKLLNRKSFQHI